MSWKWARFVPFLGQLQGLVMRLTGRLPGWLCVVSPRCACGCGRYLLDSDGRGAALARPCRVRLQRLSGVLQ